MTISLIALVTVSHRSSSFSSDGGGGGGNEVLQINVEFIYYSLFLIF